jgi:hypothetical protein
MKLLILGLLISSNVLANEWSDIKPNADFRYRLENYKDEFDTTSRSRQRMRARIGLNYKIDENTKLNIRLATAGGATSTNDTLGDSDGASTAIYTDRAYIAYKNGELNLNMGRMKNQFHRPGKSQLIWDGDLNFEGIHTSYSDHGIYLNLGSFWVKEDKSSNQDITITSSQLGYKGSAGKIKYNLGASNYHYENAHAQNYITTGNGSSGEGMNILETYLELTYDSKIPVTVFVDLTTNNEANEENEAKMFGLTIGKTKLKGSWATGLNFRTVQLNSLEARYMDSDHANQKNDNSGTLVWAKYMLSNKSYFSLGYFRDTINVDEKLDTSKDAEEYSKLQIDYGVKF